jgi:Ribbon-helix-helix protein, copG family
MTIKDEITQLIAFRAPASLAEAIDAQARSEGLSRSDVARRACMRDLQHVTADQQKHERHHA